MDIAAILAASAEDFGADARDRYAVLIATGLADLRIDPFRPASAERSEVQVGVRTYHLRHSRGRAAVTGGRVGRPRHLLVYAVILPDRVVVLRVLHDAMELSGWIAPDEAGR